MTCDIESAEVDRLISAMPGTVTNELSTCFPERALYFATESGIVTDLVDEAVAAAISVGCAEEGSAGASGSVGDPTMRS